MQKHHNAIISPRSACIVSLFIFKVVTVYAKPMPKPRTCHSPSVCQNWQFYGILTQSCINWLITQWQECWISFITWVNCIISLANSPFPIIHCEAISVATGQWAYLRYLRRPPPETSQHYSCTCFSNHAHCTADRWRGSRHFWQDNYLCCGWTTSEHTHNQFYQFYNS